MNSRLYSPKLTSLKLFVILSNISYKMKTFKIKTFGFANEALVSALMNFS